MKTIRLQSKRVMIALSILLLNAVVMTKAYASYDFEAVCPSGQTLYYNIIDATSHHVALTYPGNPDLGPWGWEYWSGYLQPSGNIILPEFVHHNGVDYAVTEIGDHAFWQCYGLTGSLTIPNSVTAVGENAFCQCGFTGSLTIPNSVTTIGEGAFYYCCGFTGSLTIPNSVTTIGEGTFYNCSGFTGSLTIPNSVTNIGNSAFAFCYNFTGALVIPDSVTSIGDEAFFACSGFTSLSIGNSVTSIGIYAFASCYQLSGNLLIPNSVVTIGEGAFGSCEGFTANLVIGNSVTTIGDYAFSWCGFTGNLILPNSLITIGEGAFESCAGFTGYLTIPDSVVTIGGGAFDWCEGLTGLTIGNSVATIGSGAFSGCWGLTSIIIPNSVTLLEGNVFSFCDGIEQITVESGNPVYDSRNNCNAIIETTTNTLVTGCINTVVPNTVTTIGAGAFCGCGLTSVNLPVSVTTIEDYAYSTCYNLTSIDIPNHVVSFGKGVFQGCNSLEQITVEAGNPVYDSRDNSNAIIETNTNILIQGCQNTVIPNSVTKIGDYAFRGFLGLTSIEMPDSVLEIGDWAFTSSGLSGKLTIGNSVTRIGDMSFYNCYDLTSIEIGNSVTRIGKQAFMDCYNLSGDLIIPNSVIVIDNFAFFYQGNDGFDGTLVLGSALDSIGSRAFAGCHFNTVVSMNETPPTIAYGDLDMYTYPDLIVCCGSKEAYEASVWANCVNSIEEDCGPHNVNIDEDNMSGGIVSASVSSAYLAEEVQLTVTPDEGMMLTSLIVSNVNDPSQTVTVYPIGNGSSAYGFAMPPFDVLVKAMFVVNNAVGEGNNIAVSAYPNPTNGQVKIEAEGFKYISISNTLGQVIYEGKVEDDVFEYDFSGQKAGIYLVRIETEHGVVVKKISVTR